MMKAPIFRSTIGFSPRTPSLNLRGACVVGLIVGAMMAATINAAEPSVPAAPMADDHELARVIALVQSGKVNQAEQACRDRLRQEPANQEFYRVLVWASQCRALPSSSRACDLARQRLSHEFGLVETSRFVLLSDAGSARTQQHARWVERTCEEFERFAAACDLQPWPLEHKLVCVLFEDHQEYQDFARWQDGMVNPSFTGYYSPRNDRVVFSLASARAVDAAPDAPTSPRPAQSKPVLGFETAQAEHARTPLHALDGHTHCQDDTAAKCAHETIHQLMFHTRLMNADLQYPLWICEGLSTAFETNNPDEPFGPDHDFAPRRRVFNSLLKHNELLSLRELVALTRFEENDPNMLRVVYHQSYALVNWLCRERPEGVRAYLNAMLAQGTGKLSRRQHRAVFEQAFGDIDTLEHQWLDHERKGPRQVSSR